MFASDYSLSIPDFEINEAGVPLGKEVITTDNIIHQLFISFRGEDTRASFTSHLYAALQNAGITVFNDYQSLPREDHISGSLLEAIEHSQIAVVVFSSNYAELRWCLQELEYIMKCHRTIGQAVVSVFYDVDPSEVSHQTGHFGKAFEKLSNKITTEVLLSSSSKKSQQYVSESEIEHVLRTISVGKDDVQRWRETLHEAASISEFVVLNSGNEVGAIKDIVEKVTRLLDKTELFVADNPA